MRLLKQKEFNRWEREHVLVVLLRGNFTFRARAKQEEPVFIIEPRIKLNYMCFGIRLFAMERNFFQYISFIFCFVLFSNDTLYNLDVIWSYICFDVSFYFLFFIHIFSSSKEQIIRLFEICTLARAFDLI